MPNLFAYFALIIWPFVTIFLYKRLHPLQATFWTIVGGFLLLPVKVEIDFPMIPPLDKESIPAIAALLGCLFISHKKIPLIPKSGLERWLVIVLLITPFITVMNNQEAIYSADRFIAGLTYYDALSAVIKQYLMLIPFFLGMQLIKTYEEQLLVFKLLVIAGLWYSLPILFEIRMSPQLHTWVYGFFPHSFGQQMRYGGFRPVVFIGHGLLVANFVVIILGTAALLWKEKIRISIFSPVVIVIYLFILLILCKSLGALVLGIFLLLAINWMSISMIKRISLFIVLMVMLYPMLSMVDYFPHQQLLELVADYDVDRAQSLGVRFKNEGELLAHAQQKIYFGWGSWGRNRLSDSITDGYWIIQLGQYGIIGFIALFGLGILPVWRAIKASRLLDIDQEKRLLAGHALIVAVVMLNQVPNHNLYSWLWFLFGALLGRANYVMKEHKFASN